MRKSLIAIVILVIFFFGLFSKTPFAPKAYAVCSEGETKDKKIIKREDFKTKEWQEKEKTIVKCFKINTAVGDINTEPQGFVKSIFTLVLGMAGGIALILIILSGYRMMASQGNPEALTNARGQLISTIVGLLFIILSFVILQVIGVDILRIPGFGE